jgi:hypothetical protein
MDYLYRDILFKSLKKFNLNLMKLQESKSLKPPTLKVIPETNKVR